MTKIDGDLTLRLTRRLEGATAARPSAVLPLTYEQRSRSRLRAHLEDGRAVGILLPRGGEPLRDGDRLGDAQGAVVQVRAAPEPVSSAEADEPIMLARAAYHLGNRHVALQIEPRRLRWLQDHVLDAMVRGLGLTVTSEEVPFEPEPGAYASGQHAHGSDALGTAPDPGYDENHRHGHGHGHGHEHEH